MIFKLNKSHSLSKHTDEQLIDSYKETGNAKYAGELYNRYAHLVYGICLKYIKHKEESKDLSMAIFEKMLSSLLSAEIQNFKKWLYTVTKNKCLTYFRDKHKKVDQAFDLQELEKKSTSFMENHDSSSLINKAFEEKRIQEAMAQLKPDQKKCMELFFFEDLSYKEIENRTGYTLKQVKSFLQNGKRKLKMILESKQLDSIE